MPRTGGGSKHHTIASSSPQLEDVDPEHPITLEIPRHTFTSILKRRLQRARRFRSLPLAAIFFAIFMAAMVARCGIIQDAYGFEKK